MLALAGPSFGMTWNTAVRRSSLRATGTAAVTFSVLRRISATSSCLAWASVSLRPAGKSPTTTIGPVMPSPKLRPVTS